VIKLILLSCKYSKTLPMLIWSLGARNGIARLNVNLYHINV
jgi:hypothetical protein